MHRSALAVWLLRSLYITSNEQTLETSTKTTTMSAIAAACDGGDASLILSPSPSFSCCTPSRDHESTRDSRWPLTRPDTLLLSIDNRDDKSDLQKEFDSIRSWAFIRNWKENSHYRINLTVHGICKEKVKDTIHVIAIRFVAIFLSFPHVLSLARASEAWSRVKQAGKHRSGLFASLTGAPFFFYTSQLSQLSQLSHFNLIQDHLVQLDDIHLNPLARTNNQTNK